MRQPEARRGTNCGISRPPAAQPGGIRGLDAELANCYRVPRVRFLVRTHTLCLSGRAIKASEGVAVWLASAAPLWVFIRVCSLLSDG